MKSSVRLRLSALTALSRLARRGGLPMRFGGHQLPIPIRVAVCLSESEPNTHFALGAANLWNRDLDPAKVEAQRCLDLSNCVDGLRMTAHKAETPSGGAAKNVTIGPTGNTIAGEVGGVAGGSLLTSLIPMLSGGAGGVDIAALAGQLVGGGVLSLTVL